MTMGISSIGYVLKQGLKNIWHNKWFSLASLATMTACIFLFGLFYTIVTNFVHIVKSAEEGVAVTVLFDDGISMEMVETIGLQIEERPEVTKINYISAEEAWENFKEQYFADSPELAEGFQEDNPLADSASYEVFMDDIESQSVLVDYIESLGGVRKVNQSKAAANTLSTFNILVGYISVAIILILLLVTVFLISNTVTVGISVRKEEIGIMKLIGARDGFVRAPFLIEGALIGIAGSLIPLFILYYVYQHTVRYVLNHFTLLTGFLQFLSTKEIFDILIPVSILLGFGIGFMGSFITVHKHLRV